MELLKNGSVDIAVVNLPDTGIGRNLKVKKVRTIQDVLIAGRNFAYLKDRPVGLKELESFPLLLLKKNSTSREMIFPCLWRQENLQICWDKRNY